MRARGKKVVLQQRERGENDLFGFDLDSV